VLGTKSVKKLHKIGYTALEEIDVLKKAIKN